MCTQPSNSAQALAMVQAGLSFLAAGSDGEVLTGLEQAEARLTAARAAVLGRFCAGRGFEADGQFAPKPWLRAFTRVTKGAAAAALSAVLDALGAKAGPEDTRTATQRRHDALEEACQRLIASGMLPGRDAQPLHLYAHVDLARLAAAQPAPGSPVEGRWSLARSVAGSGAWCLTGPDADAAACDATVIPVTIGHPDWSLADALIGLALPTWALAHDPPVGPPIGPGRLAEPPGDPTNPTGPASTGALITPAVRDRLRRLVAEHAVALLSGPTGLAAQLRAQTLDHPLSGPGQPLDLGAATSTIPPPLRRAVALRDRHCRFPGCTQPPRLARSTT